MATRTMTALGIALVLSDSLKRAFQAFRKVTASEEGRLAYSGWAYAHAGRVDPAKAALQRLRDKFDAPILRAVIAAELGRTDPLLQVFLQSDRLPVGTAILAVCPFFDPIEGDPPFERYLARYGLDTNTVRQTMKMLGEPFSDPPNANDPS